MSRPVILSVALCLAVGAGEASAQGYRVFPSTPPRVAGPVYPTSPLVPGGLVTPSLLRPSAYPVYPSGVPAYPSTLPAYPSIAPHGHVIGYPTAPLRERDLERLIQNRLQSHFGRCLDDIDVDIDMRRRCVEVEVEFEHFLPGAREQIHHLLRCMPELAGFHVRLEVDFD